MTRQKRSTGITEDTLWRHIPESATGTGTVSGSIGEQSEQQDIGVETEPENGGISSGLSGHPKVTATKGLTVEHLETLACLLSEQEKWDEAEFDARELRLPAPTRLQMQDIAEILGIAPTTVTDRVRQIERRLGTYVVVHLDAAAPMVGRRRTKSRNPEESKEHVLGNPDAGGGTQNSTELTLDGRIWGLYAEMYLDLHRLLMQATAVPQPPAPPDISHPIRRIAIPKGFNVPAPAEPQRPSEMSRKRFLLWLRHQRQHVSDAHNFLRENRYATPGNLDRLVPGYQPEPDEEPLYDYVDRFGEYPPGY